MTSLFSGYKKLNALTVSKTFYPKQATLQYDVKWGMYKDCPTKFLI